jgi:3-hydroxyanthranilate 3,4-dioxygenase
MSITRPFNFFKWIEDNKDNFKPPVNNKVVYKDAEFIIMVVGGPNSRKDYHYNESEEFFYQLKGNIEVQIQEEGKSVTVPINEGEIFLGYIRQIFALHREAIDCFKEPELKGEVRFG